MASRTGEALTDGCGGRWLIETSSGSRHLLDLDSWTYSRKGGGGRAMRTLAEGREIADVEQWPAINSRFRVILVDGERGDLIDGDLIDVESSYVTRIVRLSGDQDVTVTLPRQSLLEQVAQVAPRNAWMLIGDDASYPNADELAAQRRLRNPDLMIWTCPRQIQRGDLVFIYFVAPRKAVHFAARAMFPPVFDPSIGVNAVRSIDPNQWWTELTPLVEVEPIQFAELCALHGGHLILKGKPTHYLKPDVVAKIVERLEPLDGEQRLTLQIPVGVAELPPPASIDLEVLRGLASGALGLEATVEQYVVEPLLCMCFPEAGGYQVVPQRRVRGGVADYGVLRGDALIGVVEVKLGVRRNRDGTLADSPDVRQALRYVAATGVPALLVDANDIFLIDETTVEPLVTYARQRLTSHQLSAITAHFSAAGDT